MPLEHASGSGVRRSRPQQDARHASITHPRERRVDQQIRHLSAPHLFSDHDVVDEPGFVAELFPVARLDPGVEIPDHQASAIGDQHEDVGLPELGSQEPGVAFLGILSRPHEALAVEFVMHPQQLGTQLSNGGEVLPGRRADGDVSHEIQYSPVAAGVGDV